MASEKTPTEVQTLVAELSKLHLTHEPTEKLLPGAEQLFNLMSDDLEAATDLIEWFPSSLSSIFVLKLLEKHPKDLRTAQLASQHLPALLDTKAEEQQQKKMFLPLYSCFDANPGFEKETRQCLLRYLSTIKKPQEAEGVEPHACKAILTSLQLPACSFDEVMELVPVRAMAASKNQSSQRLVTLLEIFAEKGYNEYQAFYDANADLVKEWGLSHETLANKIRLLQLCRLAHLGSVLSYKDVAAALGINDDEVEGLVVMAVGSGLMQAKLDQLQQTVTVSYAHHALWKHDQWQQLKDTVESWQEAVTSLQAQFK